MTDWLDLEHFLLIYITKSCVESISKYVEILLCKVIVRVVHVYGEDRRQLRQLRHGRVCYGLRAAR